MMFGKNQNQTSGDKSNNIQAEVVNLGITYEQARQIAVDVFKANALDLAGIAKDVATSRAEKITESFLRELFEKKQEAVNETANPDFQYSLFEAQKNYARNGDEDIEKILVSLLVDRAEESNQSLKRIVLNEAISISAKLSSEHINIITLIFLFRHVRNVQVINLNHFLMIMEATKLPYFINMPETDGFYRYLSYTGVATVELAAASFIEIIRSSYPAICSLGMTSIEVDEILDEAPQLKDIFLRVDNEQENAFRINVAGDLRATLLSKGVSEELINKIQVLEKSKPMNDDDIFSIIQKISPKTMELKHLWDKSAAKQTILTPVGIALAHANAVRSNRLRGDLSIWIK